MTYQAAERTISINILFRSGVNPDWRMVDATLSLVVLKGAHGQTT